MTQRQKQFLQWIVDYSIANEGVVPTYEEIAEGMKVVKSAAFHMVQRLVERGYIERGPETLERSYEITEKGHAVCRNYT